MRLRWLSSGSCGLVIAAPNCRGQTWWEGRVYSSPPFPKRGCCCPPSTAKQAQLELGGPFYSGLNLGFPISCEHRDGLAGSSALQNISWAFPGEQQSPTRRGTPWSLFPCPPKGDLRQHHQAEQARAETLKGCDAEQDREKGGQKERHQERGGWDGVGDVLGGGYVRQDGLLQGQTHILGGFGTNGPPSQMHGSGGDSLGIVQQLRFPAGSASLANSLRVCCPRRSLDPSEILGAGFLRGEEQRFR